ncbi:MAG: outer membrane lipoprotein-sorting protein [Halioglobus sp.]|jgi:outer membrane lipoprotein-sorting protein
MKFTHVLSSVVAILFLSACSSSTNSVAESDEAPKEAAASVAAADENANGYRCERVPVTGTRFTKKHCSTAKQREDTAAAASSAVSQITRRATQAGGPSSN